MVPAYGIKPMRKTIVHYLNKKEIRTHGNNPYDIRIKKVKNGNFIKVERVEEIPMIKKSNSKKKFKPYGAEVIPGHGIMEEIRHKEKMKSFSMDPYDENSVMADNKGHYAGYQDVLSSTQTRSYSNKDTVNQLYINEIRRYNNRIIQSVVSGTERNSISA